LRESVHRHGARYLPRDLLARASGEPLSAAPFLAYLEVTAAEVYGVRP
jgi:carboxypeptidase Taq